MTGYTTQIELFEQPYNYEMLVSIVRKHLENRRQDKVRYDMETRTPHGPQLPGYKGKLPQTGKGSNAPKGECITRWYTVKCHKAG